VLCVFGEPLQDLDALMTSLDPRGAREAALAAILHRLEGTLRRAMQSKALADAQQLSRLSSTVTCPFPYGERGSGWKGTSLKMSMCQILKKYASLK
jgi:hypothetical protein